MPDPVCGPEDCLVKIEAAALNRADLMQREGDYPPPPGCPEWMGLEIAGTITEVGPEAAAKSNWQVGDKVCALLGGGGAFAYFKLVKNKPKTKGNDNLDDYDYGEDEADPEDEEPWETEDSDEPDADRGSDGENEDEQI